jgi:hypothetical protein
MLHVVIHVVEVIGKLHVVTEHGLQHVMTIIWDRELHSFKDVGLERENILDIINVMERDTVITHQRVGAAQTTKHA